MFPVAFIVIFVRCGHCKKLAPEYDAAAFELKEAGVVGVLAKVDANEHQEIGNKYGVQGFPTLKIFKKGVDEPIDYEGGRNTFEIVEKMKELSDPNWTPPKSEVLELTTANFDETVNNQPIMLVEFFAPWLVTFSFTPILVMATNLHPGFIF